MLNPEKFDMKILQICALRLSDVHATLPWEIEVIFNSITEHSYIFLIVCLLAKQHTAFNWKGVISMFLVYKVVQTH